MQFDLGSQATILYIAMLGLAATALFALILWIVLAFTVISWKSLLRRIADSVDGLERRVADAVRDSRSGDHPGSEGGEGNPPIK